MTNRSTAKNVLYITTAEKLFGSEKSLYDFVRYLSPEFKPMVVFPEQNAVSELFKDSGIETLFMDLNSANWLIRIFRVYKALKKHNISIIHVNYHSDLVKVFIAAKIARIPTVVHVRMTGEISLLESLMSRLVDSVLCVSNAVKTDILKTRRLKGLLPARRDNVEVIYNGREIDLLHDSGSRELFRKEYNITDDIKTVGIIGAIAPRKRQDLFLEIASALVKRRKDIKFFIVGDLYRAQHQEYLDKLLQLSKTLILSDCLTFTGRREDITTIMKGLDVLIMTSEHEALGGVIIESLAVGTPVVAYAIDGTKELIDDNENGILINSRNPAHFAAKIEELIENQEKYKRLSDKAKKRALRFDVKRQVRRIESLYNHLANKTAKQNYS